MGSNAIDNLPSEKGEKRLMMKLNIYMIVRGMFVIMTTSLIYSTVIYQKISNSISRALERCSSDEDLSFAPK